MCEKIASAAWTEDGEKVLEKNKGNLSIAVSREGVMVCL
jgi:hypothetical protein